MDYKWGYAYQGNPMLSSPIPPKNKNYTNIKHLASLPDTALWMYSCRSWTYTQKANQHGKRFSERLWWLIFQDWNVIVIKRNMRGVLPVPYRPMSPPQELLQTALRAEFTQSILLGLNHLLQIFPLSQNMTMSNSLVEGQKQGTMRPMNSNEF